MPARLPSLQVGLGREQSRYGPKMAHVEGMDGHVQSDGGLSNQRVRKTDLGRRTSEGEVSQHSVEIARSGPDDSMRSQESQQSFCFVAVATALQEFLRTSV